jgi:hypothetical protein
MPRDYIVTGPDGKPHRITAPDYMTPDQALGQARRKLDPNYMNPAPQAPPDMGGMPPGGTASGTVDMGERPTLGQAGLEAAGGIAQGMLGDPPEEIGKFLEHMTGTKLAPDVIRNKLKQWRDAANSTSAGQAGDVSGNILGFMADPFGAAGLIGKGLRYAGRGVQAVEDAARAAPKAIEEGEQAIEGVFRRGEGFTTGKVVPLNPKLGDLAGVSAEDAAAAGRSTRARAAGTKAVEGALSKREAETLLGRGQRAARDRIAEMGARHPYASRAVTGGAIGAMQPTDPKDNYLGQKSLQIGGGALFGAGSRVLGSHAADEAEKGTRFMRRVGEGWFGWHNPHSLIYTIPLELLSSQQARQALGSAAASRGTAAAAGQAVRYGDPIVNQIMQDAQEYGPDPLANPRRGQ